MQDYINLLGLLFIGGVVLGAIIPKNEEKPTKVIRILRTGETK